jgi:5-methylcytosine-specific restriction endonuclease McrA
MTKLYQFSALDKKLTELGFPVIIRNTGFRVIKGVDFNKAYREGKIEFRADGVYLTLDGKEWKGYMHLAESYLSRYNSHPKFHLTRCTTIQDFIAMGTFRQRYIWSNSNKVDLVDDTTGQEYKDITLRLCQYCSHQIFGAPSTTESFFERLDKTEQEPETIIEVDIFGYDKNWQKISKIYRQSKDYTCENCGIKPKNNFDKRFWQTHHLDGDKTNNKETNLECLCVLCHSYKDMKHEDNFDKTRMKKELDSFVEKYNTELKSINNSYLKTYQNGRK